MQKAGDSALKHSSHFLCLVQKVQDGVHASRIYMLVKLANRKLCVTNATVADEAEVDAESEFRKNEVELHRAKATR